MPAVAFCAPILPGKEETDRKGFEEILGPRRNEYDASRRRAGITREMVWHQETPDGTVAVVYLEADDIPTSMQSIATSDDPFDEWFRELVKEVHGIDMTESGPPPELLLKRPSRARKQRPPGSGERRSTIWKRAGSEGRQQGAAAKRVPPLSERHKATGCSKAAAAARALKAGARLFEPGIAHLPLRFAPLRKTPQTA